MPSVLIADELSPRALEIFAERGIATEVRVGLKPPELAAARKEIEEMSGRKVFLEVRVKVSKDWRDNQNMLNQFGYIKRK